MELLEVTLDMTLSLPTSFTRVFQEQGEIKRVKTFLETPLLLESYAQALVTLLSV